MISAARQLMILMAGFALVSSAAAQLPDPGMEIERGRTALVVTDPQNDFLSPDGVTWGVVGKSVEANDTVENLDKLFREAKRSNLPVFISPHYYYPHDHGWRFGGTLEQLMHSIGMFDRQDALSLQGFEVAVVTDATAAAEVEEGSGYEAALVNFRYLANATWTTSEAIERIQPR